MTFEVDVKFKFPFNQILSKPRHAHSLTYCLYLLSYYNGKVESLA